MDKIGIIDDLENDYKKIYNDFGKKQNNLKDVYIQFIQSFDSLFKTINNLKSYQNNKLDLAIKSSIELFLKPLTLLTENKNTKLYTSLLLILKKIVTSNLITSV